MATKAITAGRIERIEDDVDGLKKWAWGEDGDREDCASAYILLIKKDVKLILKVLWMILGAVGLYVVGAILEKVFGY